MGRQSLTSSTKISILEGSGREREERVDGRSLIKRMNGDGPSIDPCGTPELTGFVLEVVM